ncbi:putative transmembrane protein, partial [Toxoplasma gondii MAS]
MRNFGRALLVAGAVLFVAAAYSVIQARHALRHSGGHLDDFVLPVN